ncbi:hypothetical protein CANARDRAFT_28754 [[Candida] arabinofermentans NRRL YB-2248]|uniref:H/ACA ribonucleoprotein complex non-core subunit NAF1 n=1 Tax=[Candida] arabinofermentans NRRL YB-2248 TaxID=983967 RepID=A0A1E4SZX1_9ASCO|nr:hypothetical protein CANARDRAFT_28754 [[Candida] arabinofermentans NRRL YB-2248]
MEDTIMSDMATNILPVTDSDSAQNTNQELQEPVSKSNVSDVVTEITEPNIEIQGDNKEPQSSSDEIPGSSKADVTSQTEAQTTTESQPLLDEPIVIASETVTFDKPQIVEEIGEESQIPVLNTDSTVEQPLISHLTPVSKPTEEIIEEESAVTESVEIETHKESTESIDVSVPEEQQINVESLPEKPSKTSEADIFDTNKELAYSSDEFDSDVLSSSDESDSDGSSDSSTSSNDDDDSSSDDDSADVENIDNDVDLVGLDDEDNEGDNDDGPILSKNEVADEKAPEVPEDFKIEQDTPLAYVGDITGMVEKSILIKANTSGEFKVLKEGSILCFEDRTVLGPLFETFGRLQSPVYRVKFNSAEQFEKYKDKKGARVFYVVPSSEFILTNSIKIFKGTDASNWNDEELPEAEQEFSDDEKEALSKSSKKKKKKQKAKASLDNQSKQPAAKKQKTEQKPTRTELPNHFKSQLTSLPPSRKPIDNQSQESTMTTSQNIPYKHSLPPVPQTTNNVGSQPSISQSVPNVGPLNAYSQAPPAVPNLFQQMQQVPPHMVQQMQQLLQMASNQPPAQPNYYQQPYNNQASYNPQQSSYYPPPQQAPTYQNGINPLQQMQMLAQLGAMMSAQPYQNQNQSQTQTQNQVQNQGQNQDQTQPGQYPVRDNNSNQPYGGGNNQGYNPYSNNNNNNSNNNQQNYR